jgi:hypothetical protein
MLSLLPVTATAQQRRNSEGRRSDQQRSERAEERRGDRSDRSNQQGKSSNEQRNSSSDHQNSPNDQRSNNTGLTRLGLNPAQPSRVPAWEKKQTPAWEQKQTPWWERQGQPAWEQQQPHQPSWARDLKQAQDQRLGKAPARRRGNQPSVVYVLPAYRYFPNNSVYTYGVSSSTTFADEPPPNTVTMQPPAADPPAEVVTTGFLRLEVEPRHLLQVFVDGLYVGTLADLGEEIELRLGARRIELRAPGYRTLTFDTEIVSDRTVVYRGELEQIGNAPGSPPASLPIVKPAATAGSRTMFVIPGCYLGNVAPRAGDLRSGCDINKLTRIEPPQ